MLILKTTMGFVLNSQIILNINGTERMKTFSTTHEKIKCIGVSNNFIVTCDDAVLTIYRNDSFELQQFNINDLPDKNELINIMTIKGLVYCFPGSEETFYFCNNEEGNDNDYYRIKITQKNKVVNNFINSIDTIKGENQPLKKSNTKSKIFNVMAIFLGGVCFLGILNMIRLSLKSH